MYNKLLLSAGGGIINRNQQSDQAEAATLLIGLGGTGISCLRELKKEVFNKLKPDKDSPENVPTYKHIKFLAIDTDASSLGDNGSIDTIDKNTEFMDISTNNIQGLLHKIATLNRDPQFKWLATADVKTGRPGISILNATAGAGGVRQIGRLLLLQQSNEFVERVKNLINAAKSELPGDASLNIHIFTGLGGGTGSGTFMDVCYLVQYALQNMGLEGQAQTCGYFFLPDVNISHVATTQIQDYIKVNGFAAMKELDYAMNFATNGGEWNQNYGAFSFKSNVPPVKLAHLITATASDGKVRSNGYDYAMHVACEYVLEFLTKPYIPENKDDKSSNNFLTIESHISNVKSIIAQVQKEYGVCYDYCVLGAAGMYIPYKEINTYLASKIFKSFDYLPQIEPTQADIDTFVQSCGLQYVAILRELNEKVPAVPNYAVDTKTLWDQCAGISPNTIPQVLCQVRDSESKIQGSLETNKKAMLGKAETVEIDGAKQIASLISRVKTALIGIATDPAKGPFFADAILHTVKEKDLQNKIDGYITTNTNELRNAQADLRLRDEAIENTLREFQNSSALNRKKRGENYVAAVQSYYRQNAKIDLLNAMQDLLTKFKEQIIQLHSYSFGRYTLVLKNLMDTFEDNLNLLNNSTKLDTAFSKPLVTISDLKDTLDKTVEGMRLQDLIKRFNEAMLNKEEVWIEQDENRICAAVAGYFLAELDKFTNKTMDQYLHIRFDTTDNATLTRKILDEIMTPAYKEADPLFWANGSLYSITSAGEIGYCSVPETSATMKGAADALHEAHETTTRRITESTDRISVLKFICGVPLLGYMGTRAFEHDYNTKGRTGGMRGCHLYEGAPEEPRDNRKLPNIFPYSALTEDELTPEQRNAAAEYDHATANGVIELDTLNQSIINIYDEGVVDAVVENVKSAIATNDSVKMNSLKESILNAKIKNENEKRFIVNDGAQGYKEKVVKDNAIASLYLSELIEQQNRIYGKYKEAVDNFNKALMDSTETSEDIARFANAFCSGVIKVDGDYNYSYEKSDYGVSENVALSNIQTQPYGEMLPIYSAFMAFSALSSDDKEAIAVAVQNKKTEDNEAVKSNTAAVKEKIVADTQSFINISRQRYPLEQEKLVDFIKRLNAEISIL